MRIAGTVFAGAGQHGATQEEHGAKFAAALGYQPFPGSLNLRIEPTVSPLLLWGPPNAVVRAHLDFSMWAVEVEGYEGPAHAMTWKPPRLFHRRIELLAPCRLRGLGDSLTFWRA